MIRVLTVKDNEYYKWTFYKTGHYSVKLLEEPPNKYNRIGMTQLKDWYELIYNYDFASYEIWDVKEKTNKLCLYYNDKNRGEIIGWL